MGVGTKEGLSFDRGFLGDKGTLLQYLHHALNIWAIGDPFKNGGPTSSMVIEGMRPPVKIYD